ncbi:hypothetical protein MHI43_01480 [Paenibacillus sp. FSL H8-0457]|uniref:hypothetical protein n=1 Tax=unclassified Paenibacillus TaxID=185978 RepID=UPI0003E1FBAB|nr:hypothetical protein [Paenibacillus sp. FSL H8-457]ETT60120.1 hypothetical protein C172_24838 [Paenibacillus sp. FSL H8-457]
MFQKPSKMMPVREFWFLFVISLLILVTINVLAVLFGTDKTAGAVLNFTATAISIVLAVIAILITLLDIAGQKNSVHQLAELSQELQSSSDNIKDRINEVAELKNEFLKSITENEAFRKEIISQLEELKADMNPSKYKNKDDSQKDDNNSEFVNEKLNKIIENLHKNKSFTWFTKIRIRIHDVSNFSYHRFYQSMGFVAQSFNAKYLIRNVGNKPRTYEIQFDEFLKRDELEAAISGIDENGVLEVFDFDTIF